MGCHLLLQCIKVKSETEVAQPCPNLSDPMDCSPPGSSVHGIFQARVLEWGSHISFNSGFLSVYGQQWDCWVIQQFYFQFFVKGISTLFSIAAVRVYIPTNSVRWSPFLHTLSSTYACRLFDSSQSDRCEMMPYCGFGLHFSDNE